MCVDVVVKTLNLEIVIWQATSKNCTKKWAARAARLFFLIQPMRSLFSGVVGNREFNWLDKMNKGRTIRNHRKGGGGVTIPKKIIPAKENSQQKEKFLQAVHPSKKIPASKLNQSMISKHKAK